MTVRDKLLQRSRAFLEPGEAIEQIFTADRYYLNPSWALPVALLALALSILLFLLQNAAGAALMAVTVYILVAPNYRVIIATDRAILMLKASNFRTSHPYPTGILKRLPRDTRIGPVSPVSTLWGRPAHWGTVSLNGERLFIRQHFHADVDAADEALIKGVAAARR